MKIVQKTRKFFFDQILSQIQNTPKKVKTFLNVFSFYSKENPRIFEILQKIKNNPEIFRTRYGLLESIIIELKNQKTVLVFLKILLNLLCFSFWIKYFDSELSEKTKKKIKEKIKSTISFSPKDLANQYEVLYSYIDDLNFLSKTFFID